ncbi:hypothetical protein FDZ84_18565 [Saccharopolyspora sp. ASAGF58]|nr:hypothetical protein FDZ84_18565 [Saccharopolyspora sp. ASAGF58]
MAKNNLVVTEDTLQKDPNETPDGIKGIGILESAHDIKSLEDGSSWVEAGLAYGGMAMEVVSMAVDPIGTLLSYGLSWLIEHVQPLKEALDWFAGDPDGVKAYGQTWGKVSEAVKAAVEQYNNAVKADTAEWTGAAGDAYRKHATEKAEAVAGAGELAGTLSSVVTIMGEVVSFVREFVRDLVAECIAAIITYALEAVCTLGLGTPVIVAQVTAKIAKVTSKIGDVVKKLIKTISNVAPKISKMVEVLGKVIKKLGSAPDKIAEGVWKKFDDVFGTNVVGKHNAKVGGLGGGTDGNGSGDNGSNGSGNDSGSGSDSGSGNNSGNGSDSSSGNNSGNGNNSGSGSDSNTGSGNDSGSGSDGGTGSPGSGTDSGSGSPNSSNGPNSGNGSSSSGADSGSPRSTSDSGSADSSPSSSGNGSDSPNSSSTPDNGPRTDAPSDPPSSPNSPSSPDTNRPTTFSGDLSSSPNASGAPSGGSPDAPSSSPSSPDASTSSSPSSPGNGSSPSSPDTPSSPGNAPSNGGGHSPDAGNSPSSPSSQSPGGSPGGSPAGGGAPGGGPSLGGGPSAPSSGHSPSTSHPNTPSSTSSSNVDAPTAPSPTAPSPSAPRADQPGSAPAGGPMGGPMGSPGGHSPGGASPSSGGSRPGSGPGGGWTGTPGSPGAAGRPPSTPDGPPRPRGPEGSSTHPSAAPRGRPDAPSRPSGPGGPHSPTRPHGGPDGPTRPGGPGGSTRPQGEPDTPRPGGPGDMPRPRHPDGSVPNTPGRSPDGPSRPGPDGRGPGGTQPRTDTPGTSTDTPSTQRPTGTNGPGQRPDTNGPGSTKSPDATKSQDTTKSPDTDKAPDTTKQSDANDAPDKPKNETESQSKPDGPDNPKDGDKPNDPDADADKPEPGTPEYDQKIDDGVNNLHQTDAGASGHTDPNMQDLANRVPNDGKHFTVDAHHGPDGLQIGGRNYSPDELADVLRRSGWDGESPIRLLSCDSGDFASDLAKKLGVDVTAPNGKAWSDGNGNVFASSTAPDSGPTWPPDGGWETHSPDGSKSPASDDAFHPSKDGEDPGDRPTDAEARGNDEFDEPPERRVVETIVHDDLPSHYGDAAQQDAFPDPITDWNRPDDARFERGPGENDPGSPVQIPDSSNPKPLDSLGPRTSLSSLSEKGQLEPWTRYEIEGRGAFFTDDSGRIKWAEVDTTADGYVRPNIELRQPAGNAQYRVDDNWTFNTNEHGQTERMSGTPHYKGASDSLESDRYYRDEYSQNKAGDEGRAVYPNRHWAGGHAAAHEAGAPGEYINMFPQMATSNSGHNMEGMSNEASWRNLEQHLSDHAQRPGCSVDRIEVEAVRDPDGIPTEVRYRWIETENGVSKVMEAWFPNRPEFNYREWEDYN